MFSIQGIRSGLTNHKNYLLIAAAIAAAYFVIKKVTA